MQAIQAVLFDFGMVLSGPPRASTWMEMQRVSGLDGSTLHRLYWAHRDDYDSGTLTGEAYWDRIAQDAGTAWSPSVREALLALDVELWTDMNAPMLAWVEALHRAGVRTGILSNMGDRMASGIADKFDWIGGFHHLVWSHALLTRKPDPAIYAAAANGLQLPPAAILFLDDKEENIRAAEACGMQGIVYRDHAQFVAEMDRNGWSWLLDPAAASLSARKPPEQIGTVLLRTR